VNQITIPQQRKGDVWEQLKGWADRLVAQEKMIAP